MHPIYIPSRHRPDCNTARILQKAGINFRIVIEPHDAEQYLNLWHPAYLIELPKDHQGVNFSRNFIKSHSMKLKQPFHWQMDDDILGFVARPQGQKSFPVAPIDAIKQVENLMEKYDNIGIAGPNQNSWPPSGGLMFNAMPVQAVLINNQVRANYRNLILMGDFDFVLQVLREGWCSAMYDDLRVVTPGGHKQAGGLKEVYDRSGIMKQAAMRLISLWPGMKGEEKPDGSIRLQKKKFMRQFITRPNLREI
jgi:hypothetical protein